MLVTEAHIEKIMELGLDRAPNEACGVIAGRAVLEIENLSESPHDSYMVEGRQIVESLRIGGFENDEIIIWHTHPSGFVGPSEGDLRTRIEGLHYLVVSLPNGEAVQY